MAAAKILLRIFSLETNIHVLTEVYADSAAASVIPFDNKYAQTHPDVQYMFVLQNEKGAGTNIGNIVTYFKELLDNRRTEISFKVVRDHRSVDLFVGQVMMEDKTANGGAFGFGLGWEGKQVLTLGDLKQCEAEVVIAEQVVARSEASAQAQQEQKFNLIRVGSCDYRIRSCHGKQCYLKIEKEGAAQVATAEWVADEDKATVWNIQGCPIKHHRTL